MRRDSDRSATLTVIASVFLPVAASATVADMGTAMVVAVAAAVCFRLWVVDRGPGRNGLTATRRHSPSGPPVAGRQPTALSSCDGDESSDSGESRRASGYLFSRLNRSVLS